MNSHNNAVKAAFATLGLGPDASNQQVKEAYRDLVQVWHPDRFSHNARLRSQAEEKLREINSAYEVLEEYLSGQDQHTQANTQAFHMIYSMLQTTHSLAILTDVLICGLVKLTPLLILGTVPSVRRDALGKQSPDRQNL